MEKKDGWKCGLDDEVEKKKRNRRPQEVVCIDKKSGEGHSKKKHELQRFDYTTGKCK